MLPAKPQARASLATTPPMHQAPTPSQNDALRSLVECAQSFQQGMRVTEHQAAKVAAARVACEWHLRHAGEKALAVQLDRLAAWAKSFNIPHDPQAMPAAYASLATIPPDLLPKAFDRVMAATDDTFRLPLPAKIRAHVSEEIDRRIATRGGLHRMSLAPIERRGKRSPEEIAQVAAAVARAKAALAAGGVALRGSEHHQRPANAEFEASQEKGAA
jgi:hypothetical protein